MSATAKAVAVELSNCAGMYKTNAEWFGGLMSAIKKHSEDDVASAFAGKGASNSHTVVQLASIGEYLAGMAESDAVDRVALSEKFMRGEA